MLNNQAMAIYSNFDRFAFALTETNYDHLSNGSDHVTELVQVAANLPVRNTALIACTSYQAR
jgi:hypothetical protein